MRKPTGTPQLATFDVADRPAEQLAADLARGDEPHLGLEHVAAGEVVDEQREKRNVPRSQGCAARARPCRPELAVFVEDRDLVLGDRELRLHRDGRIGPLVDDQILRVVWTSDEQLRAPFLHEVEQAHLAPPLNPLRGGEGVNDNGRRREAMATDPAEQVKAREFKCTACGGEQSYDAASGQLKCKFCGALLGRCRQARARWSSTTSPPASPPRRAGSTRPPPSAPPSARSAAPT